MSTQSSFGIHSLDHFQIAVPEVEAARAFFSHFGLDVRSSGSGLDLFTFGSQQRWVSVVPGARKQLTYLSFSAFDDDIVRFEKRLSNLGVGQVQGCDQEASSGLWIKDPHGILLQIKAAEKSSPNERQVSRQITRANARSAPLRTDAPKVRPTRMAHALFFTPNIEATISFYAEVLGLKLSDYPGPVAFMHGIHGSDHHLIAFAQSSATGYHHSAWEVDSLDAIGLGAAQMADAGYTKGWGLGRHVLGSNYFHYVQDPWGSFAEYSFDIDFVPAGSHWEAGYPSPENSFYLWGPPPPPDFVTNYEAQTEAIIPKG